MRSRPLGDCFADLCRATPVSVKALPIEPCRLVGDTAMRTLTVAVFATSFGLTMAQAQQTQSTAQATTPIAGLDYTALAGSARASKLIGSKVYQGDTSIGQIEDILVDLDHSTLTAVVLSVGGFLGVGDKLVAVPVSRIKVGSEAKFTTDLTKEQLTSAPAFDFGKLR